MAPNYDGSVLLAQELERLNIKTVFTKTNKSFPSLSFSAVFKEIITGRYDVVHSHGFSSGIYASVPAKLKKLRHVMTAHDIFNEAQFSGYKGLINKFIISILFQFIDKIHCVSDDARDNLIRFFPKLKNIVTIPHGIEIKQFLDADVRDFREELKLGADVFIIGFLGRYMAPKGFKYLIDAMNKVCKLNATTNPIVICFGEDGGFLNRDRDRIRKLNLQDNFIFVPFEKNPASSLKGLDVVVMPSLWEAFGLLAIETMVAGTPIIASNCIGLRCVLKDTPAIKIPVKDSEYLASMIVKEMNDSSKNIFKKWSNENALKYDVSRKIKLYTDLYE